MSNRTRQQAWASERPERHARGLNDHVPHECPHDFAVEDSRQDWPLGHPPQFSAGQVENCSRGKRYEKVQEHSKSRRLPTTLVRFWSEQPTRNRLRNSDRLDSTHQPEGKNRLCDIQYSRGETAPKDRLRSTPHQFHLS